MARRRGPGINLPRTLGTLRAGEADGGSGEGAPAYLAEEHGDRSRAPEHADPTAEPRRANHSKPGTTASLSNPHPQPQKRLIWRGADNRRVHACKHHANTHPADRRRLASGLLRLPRIPNKHRQKTVPGP